MHNRQKSSEMLTFLLNKIVNCNHNHKHCEYFEDTPNSFYISRESKGYAIVSSYVPSREIVDTKFKNAIEFLVHVSKHIFKVINALTLQDIHDLHVITLL